MALLTAVAILVFFGVAQRVLDKMHLSDRTALLLVALMFFGTLIPNLSLGNVRISVGGALIPAGVCVYLLVRAGTWKERLRAVLGALITGGVVFAVSVYLLPDEPEAIAIDPQYLNGIVAGAVAYALGRSRRGAFICGVLGVLFADVVVGIVNSIKGVSQPLTLGGAGVFDAAVIAGLIGVLLTELVGEILERVARGNEGPVRSAVRAPARRKEK